MAGVPDTAARPPDLWDPVVRITHWGIAAVVLLNFAVTEDGSLLHIWVGWAGLALLTLRLVWGLVGASEARFSAFPPNPAAAVSHLRALLRGAQPHYRSHNPAGALMVYLIWFTFAVVIGTGIAMTGTGPLGSVESQALLETLDWSQLDFGDSREDDELGEAFEEVHEMAANLLLVLVMLHVVGVAAESLLLRRNLVAAMLTGSGRHHGPTS